MSQSENAVPRILRHFQADIDHHFARWEEKLPNEHLFHGRREISSTTERQKNGGIYSWQPDDVRTNLIGNIRSRLLWGPTGKQDTMASRKSFTSRLLWHLKLAPGSWLFSFLLVLFSVFTGMLISALVPPIGFWCRNWGELAIGVVWILSDFLDCLPTKFGFDSGKHYDRIYQFVFIKDFLFGISTLGLVLLVQVGVMNKCYCYSIEGSSGLALPQMRAVASTLSHGIESTYPAIAFLCIGFELLIFPGIVWYQHREAFSVFLQRDDGKSNLRHWHQFCKSMFCRSICNFGFVLRHSVSQGPKTVWKAMWRAIRALGRQHPTGETEMVDLERRGGTLNPT